MTIFLFRLNENSSRLQDGETNTTRTFLLVVGLGYQLLAIILETGVGGCTALQHMEVTVRPDPFYVDQAASTLEHLEEMGIPLVCERWLTLPPNPDILDVDQFYLKAAKKKKYEVTENSSSSSFTGPGTGGIVLRRTKSIEYSKGEQLSITSSEESEEVKQKPQKKGSQNDIKHHEIDSSGSTSEYSEEMQTAFRGDDGDRAATDEKISKETEDESRSESVWELPKSGLRTRHNFTANTSYSTNGMQSTLSVSLRGGSSASSTSSSSYRKYLEKELKLSSSDKVIDSVVEEDEAEFVTYRISQLSVSFETTVFHYCHLNIGQGVYLSPLKTSCDSFNEDDIVRRGEGPLHKQFLANFEAACQIIHSTFKLSQTHRENLLAANIASDLKPRITKPWINKCLVAIKEQVC